jgi:hypothetical protein
MAKNSKDEYKRITINSLKDPKGGAYAITDYDKDRRAIERAIKSALPEDSFYHVSPKKIAKSGRFSEDIYVDSDYVALARKAITKTLKGITFSGGTDPKYKATRPIKLTDDEEKIIQELDKQDKDKQKSKEDRDKNKSKKDEGFRLKHGTLLKILSAIMTVADIARRILSSVLTFANQSLKDSITAHNLDTSYEAVRQYRHIETAHGLKEGTITGALADIQNKFGNITTLDEKALEDLAVVMGGKIEEMATLGLGSSNPEKILESIIDTFNERANSGVNSIGQYVGEQQARRELYSYLLKISPQIADIFATMQEEQHNINSLFRNQADTFSEWKNALPTSRGNNTSMDYNLTVSLGEEWNVIKDIAKQIKEGIDVNLTPTVLAFLQKLADTRVGLSETQNRQRNEENKKANTAFIQKSKKEFAEMDKQESLSETEKFYYLALKEYVRDAEAENKGNKITGNIGYAVPLPEQIRVRANQMMRKQYLASVGKIKEDVTVEDIKDVLDSYEKFDLEKEKKKYQDTIVKQNEQRRKAVDKEVKRRVKESKYWSVLAKAKEDYKNSEEYKNLKYGQKIDKKRNLLAEVKGVFKKDYLAMFNGDVDKAYKQAIKDEYIVKSGKGLEYITNQNKYIPPTESEIRKQVNVETPYTNFSEEGFLTWLYQKNLGWFNTKILGKELDQSLLDSESNPWASIYTLYETEGTKQDWRDKIPTTYDVEGKSVIATNDYSGGEVVHKIILDINNNGIDEGDVVLGSFMGMPGVEGGIGTLNVNMDNGKIDYSIVRANGASQGD